jgi:hypothetical protein
MKKPKTKSSVSSAYWGLALEGPDPQATVSWFADRVWRGRSPEQLVMSYKPQRAPADWLERMTSGGKDDVAAYFTADRSESLVVHSSGVVTGRFPFRPDLDEARRRLEEAPFEVASFDTLHDEWSTIDKKYRPPSFGHRHFPHGWGCAFKGAGHERLVSRRWLAFGPWVLARGSNDLSLVQFHALDASAKEALKQAKPSHKAMGITDEGGFLQRHYVFKTPLAGLYDAAEQTLRIVVLGRDPAPVELRDARAAVKQGALTAAQPLKRVAYVFPKPAEAERHLHALWLRELECWTVVDGIERRLDLEYQPQPIPPAWAA